MTDADLDHIELALGLELPAFYRRFMLDYPRWLVERQPEWTEVEKWELTDDPDRVIEFNQQVRGAAPGTFFDDRPWPPHYFVIGSEEEQNWYFLDLSEGSEAVYWFHHERGAVGEVCQSLDRFPDTLLDEWADIESAGGQWSARNRSLHLTPATLQPPARPRRRQTAIRDRAVGRCRATTALFSS